jgi:hypothetical protein
VAEGDAYAANVAQLAQQTLGIALAARRARLQ